MLFFYSLLIFFLLTGCSDGNVPSSEVSKFQEVKVMLSEVTIKMGELGPDFANRYGSAVKVVNSTPNVNFYSVDWNKPQRGVVRVDHGKNSFSISDVLGVQAAQELKELKSEGLNSYTVFSGISESDLIPHDEARKRHYEILRKILDSGWRSVTAASRPRLTGVNRFNYALTVSDSIGLGIDYTPTLEEWMRIPSHTAWKFYANGLFLEVSFTRERTLTDPTKPGSYLLSFTIETDTEFFRGYAGPENRLRWKEFVKPELAKLAPLRAKAEAELRAKGIPIDETYQDPPLPAVLQR
jgi:hypothetical protein